MERDVVHHTHTWMRRIDVLGHVHMEKGFVDHAKRHLYDRLRGPA
jgi:hypothetical protein